MSKAAINAVVWIVVLLVVAGLWFFGARSRLHLVDPLEFIALVAVAAAILTAAMWWEMTKNPDEPTAPAPTPDTK